MRASEDIAPIMVEGDADRIGQVVTNYVTNALKCSPPDQPVDVSVATRRGRAHVAVRDAGPGIPRSSSCNFVVHLLAGLIAYGHQPKKPSLFQDLPALTT